MECLGVGRRINISKIFNWIYEKKGEFKKKTIVFLRKKKKKEYKLHFLQKSLHDLCGSFPLPNNLQMIYAGKKIFYYQCKDFPLSIHLAIHSIDLRNYLYESNYTV